MTEEEDSTKEEETDAGEETDIEVSEPAEQTSETE